MAFEHQGAVALDYEPCRYGKSKLLFRGPKRRLDQPFVAALGGSETYGKFVETPWPELAEAKLGLPVVNFAVPNAGLDVFLNDCELGEVLQRSKLTVLQVLGAHNLSNRYYAVHPRRNDRFLRASQLMRSVFKEIDFTEFNFTRHMLQTLQRRAPERFEILADELRNAWVARMRLLIERSPAPVVLLWLGEFRAQPSRDALGPEPLLVTREMVDRLRPLVAEVVQVEPSMAARAMGTEGMLFGPLEGPVAAETAGVMVHQEMAEKLAKSLAAHLT